MDPDAPTERKLWASLEALERTVGTLVARRQTYRPKEMAARAATPPVLPRAELRPAQADGGADAGPAPAAEVFQVVAPIGEGGMGVIYRALQGSLRREVAIKQIRTDAPEQVGEFLAEARITARLEHANIVPVHLLGQTPQGAPLLAMKLVKGTSWAGLIHAPPERRTSLREHLRILLGACNAVAFAHERGIIHRDLKPANVMVGEFGQVFVVDWGIAAALDGAAGAEAGAARASDVGEPAGTPLYMAPELARGDGAQQDARTDVYLLGACLHEVLAGSPPHGGPTLYAVLVHAVDSPPFDYDATVPRELAAICHRAMAPDREDRFPDVASFQKAIEEFLEHREAYRLIERGASLVEDLQRRVEAHEGPPVEARGELDRAIHGLHGEARLAFEHARMIWPEAPDALRGQRAASALLLRHAVQTKDAALAARMLPECDDPDLCARARALQEAAAAQAQELEGLRSVVRRLDGSALGAPLAAAFVVAGAAGALGAFGSGLVARRGVAHAEIVLGAIWLAVAATSGLYAVARLRGGRAPDSMVSPRVVGVWAAVALTCIANGVVEVLAGRGPFTGVHGSMLLVGLGFASMAFTTRRWLLAPAAAFLLGAIVAGARPAWSMEVFGVTWLCVMSGVGAALRLGATLGERPG